MLKNFAVSLFFAPTGYCNITNVINIFRLQPKGLLFEFCFILEGRNRNIQKVFVFTKIAYLEQQKQK